MGGGRQKYQEDLMMMAGCVMAQPKVCHDTYQGCAMAHTKGGKKKLKGLIGFRS